MRPLTVFSVLAAIAQPTVSLADDVTFSGGVSVTSNAVSDGLSDTKNGPAIQPFFELSKDGFYAGIWASNQDDADGNRFEADLSGGYRGETAAGLTYELGYTQYLYDQTHDFSAEIAASVGYPINDQLTVGAEVSYDLGEKTFGEDISAEFAVSDAWAVHADVGLADPGSDVNRGIGVSYASNDRTSFDLSYVDTTTTRGLLALTLTYTFGAAAP